MYGSRRGNASRLKEREGLMGVAVGKGDRAPSLLAPAPPSPEDPTPGGIEMRRPSGATWDGELEPAPEAEYAREAAKAQIQSITGRMFQLLDDYDESTTSQDSSHAKGYANDLSRQVEGIANDELKTNIQTMIVDYNEMCHEREDLLCSLADWFEEGHIDDLVEDARHRRNSVTADPVGLRQSILEGKKASERLKAVNAQMEEATSQGEPLSHLQKEKEQLEKELMKSVKFMDATTNVHQSGMQVPADTAKVVNDSWKYAAVEICGMLHQVRDSGSADMQLLEIKITEMVNSMNQQTNMIEQLNSDLTTQKEMVTFADMTTSRLSEDNFLLKEELDAMRGELLQAKKLVATLQAQVHESKTETEMAKKAHKKDPESCRPKTSDDAESQGMDTELHKAQLSDLNKRAKALEQENDTLKASCKTLEEEVKSLKSKLQSSASEGEIDKMTSTGGCESREDTVCNDAQSSSHSGKASAAKISTPAPARISTAEQENATSSKKVNTQVLVEVESLKKEREEFLQQMTELHQQLQSSWDESASLRTLLETMEAELLALRRENHELLLLQEKGADLIRHASQVLTFSEPARDTMTETGDTQTSGNTTHTLSLSQNKVERESLPAAVVVGHESHDLPQVMVVTDTETSTSWSVGGSVVQDSTGDDGEFEFAAPMVGSTGTVEVTRTSTDKKGDSCKMVMDLLYQLNENHSDLVNADSEALMKMQHELQKVCQMVARFLDFSTGLVNDEADVMSKAMSTLMTHLPEGEKPALRQVIHNSRSQFSNLKLNPGSHQSSRQTVLREKVALFADQAIEALKESEKMLSSKIHSQHKKLQTVMHAMAEHKKKQSQTFKFPVPEDVKGLVLEAKALSTHNISEKINHREHLASLQRTRLERMKLFQHSLQHSPPYSYAHAGRFPTHPLGGFAIGGMRNPSFIAGMSTSTAVDGEENQGMTQLQIDTTHHHHVHSNPGQTPTHSAAAGYIDSHSPNGPQQYMHSHRQQATTVAGDSMRGTGNVAINTKHRSRKPKLYKPFHSHSKEKPAFLQVGGYVPPRTAPVGATGRGPFTTFGLQGRTGPQMSRHGARTEALRASQFEPSRMSNPTTFYDILAQSNTLSPREHHHRPDQSPANTATQWRDGHKVVKLPPL